MQIYVITCPVYSFHFSHGSTLHGRFYKGHVEFVFDHVVENGMIYLNHQSTN